MVALRCGAEAESRSDGAGSKLILTVTAFFQPCNSRAALGVHNQAFLSSFLCARAALARHRSQCGATCVDEASHAQPFARLSACPPCCPCYRHPRQAAATPTITTGYTIFARLTRALPEPASQTVGLLSTHDTASGIGGGPN